MRILFKQFLDMYKNLYDQSFPVVKVKGSIPGLTVGLSQKSIKKDNKLNKISVKHPKAHNETVYENYRNMLHSLLKLEEKEYYQSMIIAKLNQLGNQYTMIKPPTIDLSLLMLSTISLQI